MHQIRFVKMAINREAGSFDEGAQVLSEPSRFADRRDCNIKTEIWHGSYWVKIGWNEKQAKNAGPEDQPLVARWGETYYKQLGHVNKIERIDERQRRGMQEPGPRARERARLFSIER